jgi:glutaredoxin 3
MSVIVWSKNQCPYCDQAKALLTQRGVKYEERKIGEGFTKEQLLEDVPTARSVPQIIINGKVVGGFTELKKYIDETGYNGTGY